MVVGTTVGRFVAFRVLVSTAAFFVRVVVGVTVIVRVGVTSTVTVIVVTGALAGT